MVDILVTILVFFFTSLSHILLYKTVGEKTITGVRLFFTVYFVGFLVELIVVTWILPKNCSLPLSSILFYLLATGIYFILYIGAFLGDESPATKIFNRIRKTGQATHRELVNCFSDKELIFKRIDEMKKVGWISEKKGSYSLTPKGLTIMKIVSFYQKLLKWERSG